MLLGLRPGSGLPPAMQRVKADRRALKAKRRIEEETVNRTPPLKMIIDENMPPLGRPGANCRTAAQAASIARMHPDKRKQERKRFISS